MEQQESNVGGQVAGMAQSVSAQSYGAPAAGQQPHAGMPFSAAASHAANQPAEAVASSTNPTAQAENINNNDVSNTTVALPAEDSDLIEKEWVEKAKAIVEKTRKDPFRQSFELNQLKAEYLQKRYGKNVGSDGQ